MCYMSTFSRQLPDTSGIILLRQLAVKYCGSLQKEEKEEEEEEERGREMTTGGLIMKVKSSTAYMWCRQIEIMLPSVRALIS